jgi:hypothetical protein
MSDQTILPANPPTARPNPRRRLTYYGWAGLLGVTLISGAAPNSAAPQAPPAPQSVTAPAKPPTASPMDEPLRLIAEARKSFQSIKDYTCIFVKREHIGGTLQPENQINMKVRNQPFSVYLKWLAPRSQVGQEACYVAGKNNGMMRARSPGVLGAVGWVSLDPKDPRVRQNSRHSITEAGIGNLIERFANRWEVERKAGLTQVRINDFEFAKRRCTRVETIHPENGGKQFQTYRNVLYFDKETNLPIRIEAYDWPKQGGNPDGELLEVYSYVNLRFNVELGDEAFNY